MKRAGTLIIVNALIWGFVIIACSIALKETGTFKQIQFILGGGATASLLLMAVNLQKKNQE